MKPKTKCIFYILPQNQFNLTWSSIDFNLQLYKDGVCSVWWKTEPLWTQFYAMNKPDQLRSVNVSMKTAEERGKLVSGLR